MRLCRNLCSNWAYIPWLVVDFCDRRGDTCDAGEEAHGGVGQPNSTAVSHLRMLMDDSVLISLRPKNSSSRYLVQRIRGLRKRGVSKIVKLARHWSIPCIGGS